MNPVDVIVSALVAGLSSGATAIVKSAIEELHKALREKLAKKVEPSSTAKEALAKLEKQPESNIQKEALKSELAKLELDSELIELARSILTKMDPQSGQNGKYNITIQNSHTFLVGDGNELNITTKKE